ncbi:MAG: DUF4238 domain-containing protein [Rhodospirillales bacterium]|nr:DUF4238 domain-containing protein [Rhodospirillales bacterium]
MTNQVSAKHHFVPKLLLRPWLVKKSTGGDVLRGYWWNPRSNALVCKIRGLDSFCFQLDLLTLNEHVLGRDAVERIFFGDIDTQGALARDIILDSGPAALTIDQRSDFARLLLSLEARRPANVKRLRTEGTATFRNGLNNDPEILREFEKHGINMPPSDFVEQELGRDLEDSALTIVQSLVDNPIVGGRLINACWHVRKLNRLSGSIVLSDRPLIRVHGYDQPGATWLLPLSPDCAFIACNDKSNLARLMRLSDERFVKEINRTSVGQAERFVFCIDRSHEKWIGRHLRGGSLSE